MPESRQKYLYERLGDHDFQLLVGALLTHRFQSFVPLPLRQADGGRDGVASPDRTLIYQVKWSATGGEKNPVQWLKSIIAKESDAIRRLAAGGVRKYILATNVPSTGGPSTGTFDQLDDLLRGYSVDFGLEMTALWREAIDAMVDGAPTEIKWAYADMLAGWDLIRYLVSEQAEHGRDTRLRQLLHRVAATQWLEDERIKFSQAELDRELLTDLFIDVPAERVQAPRRVAATTRDTHALGGAASYLTSKGTYPLTLVRGVPGQGKSTLSQLVCQSYRAAFMPDSVSRDGLVPTWDSRFPIRFDLSDYAAWMEGFDVFDESGSDQLPKGKKRATAECTVECFLAELIAHAAGDGQITASDIHELLERVPAMIVMDGLDEVGKQGTRRTVVREIDLFCARGGAYAVEPRVVVTTRPNSSGLPEPDDAMFEIVSLSPLDHALRDQYLRKWCNVHNVRGNDGRTLRRNFNQKVREPYIGELVGNPMQLTILLYLLRQSGDATPSQRTELYDAYMAMLLAREANKHPDSVRRYRTELMEIVPFLGWYMQSRAEEQGHAGRMTYAQLEAAMKHFQRTYLKKERVVDELFKAASDRLWALTSKEEGSFEFEVLSLREYFAARYLYMNAGEGDYRFDRTTVLRELLKRPYWLNTARFYAGNAHGADLYVLKAGVSQELAANRAKQVRVAAWSLITDGVFNTRPVEAGAIVDELTDDESCSCLIEALDGKEIAPLPEPEHADVAWRRLTAAIAADPAASINHLRVRVLRELLRKRAAFQEWWLECYQGSVGTAEETAWLEVGAACEVLAGVSFDFQVPSTSDAGYRAQLILNTGVVPTPGGPLEDWLLSAVLAGQCSETTSLRSRVAQIAVALSPLEFYGFGPDLPAPHPAASPDRRSQAIQLLRKSDPEYARIAGLRRFRRGEKGTTYPWANTAQALLERAGPCWLVSEIAVIGAASSLRDGYTLAPGTKAFGPNSRPATLIAEARRHRRDIGWWLERLGDCTDELSRAEWLFACTVLASGDPDGDLGGILARELESVSAGLSRSFTRVIRIAMSRETESNHSLRSTRARTNPLSSRQLGPKLEPLAAVARHGKWFMVDRVASYK